MRGSCLCAAVVFDVQIGPGEQHLYQCHCSQCRQVTGSACNTAFLVDLERFTWVSGEASVRLYRKPTGYTVAFCDTCGSTVPNVFKETRWWIPAGLLESDAGLLIVRHQCVASKARWDTIGDDAERYDALPPSPLS